MDLAVSAKVRELGVRLGAVLAPERLPAAVDVAVLLETAKVRKWMRGPEEIPEIPEEFRKP